jgi:xylulokinase
MNAITWMDSRGAPYVKAAIGNRPRILGYNIFKALQWLPKTGGCPTLSGKDDIAHVLLIKNRWPEIYEETHKFLPSKDYLNLKLTGEFAASYDSIQLFWITDIRDAYNIHYDTGLIRMLGLDPSKLPVLKASTDILGLIHPDVAKSTGLSPRTRVVVGSPDHQAACIGSGAVKDFEGHIYIGTSSWIQCIVPFKKTDPFHSIASFPTAIPGKYQSVNEQDMAGGCLDVVIDNIIHGHQAPERGKLESTSFRDIDEMAAKSPAGGNTLIFTPWLNGERTPVDDTSLRGGIYNISKITTRHDLLRAILEGVAYNTRWSLGYVERFVNRKFEWLNMVGGGAVSDLWCQIFADVLNRDIRQVEHPMQTNARGAAWIAAVGLNYIRFDDIPKLIRIKRVYRPNPENRRIYDLLFKEFVGIYRRNRAMFKRLNRISPD